MAANKMDRLDLYGRTAERAAIRGLLDGVRTSGSGVLVIRGQAGIGKSALLQDAVDNAADIQVLRSQGVETEVALPLAGLHQLLRPLLAGLDRLPTHHALALRRALGIEPPGGQDGFLVALATLGLLADAAENAPVLCVVDDVHWLEEASVTALLFVARRLGAERVVMPHISIIRRLRPRMGETVFRTWTAPGSALRISWDTAIARLMADTAAKDKP